MTAILHCKSDKIDDFLLKVTLSYNQLQLLL